MTVIGHLTELRSRLIKALLAFFVMSVVAWFLYEPILHLLIAPISKLPESARILSKGKLIYTSPVEPLFIRLKVTSFAGLVLSLPVVLWQLWRFVTPGLRSNEKRYALPFVMSALTLFALGAVLAILTMPAALLFLSKLAPSTTFDFLPKASEYLSFVLLLVVAFGASFEFPIVLVFLALVGIIDSRKLRKSRGLALVLVLVVAAVVTPTQDPFTQVALSVPMYLLYEATIVTVRLMKR
ncbi:MAG: twin-arginine translocase subunit TatC [Actinomycetota bacterium]